MLCLKYKGAWSGKRKTGPQRRGLWVGDEDDQDKQNNEAFRLIDDSVVQESCDKIGKVFFDLIKSFV